MRTHTRGSIPESSHGMGIRRSRVFKLGRQVRRPRLRRGGRRSRRGRRHASFGVQLSQTAFEKRRDLCCAGPHFGLFRQARVDHSVNRGRGRLSRNLESTHLPLPRDLARAELPEPHPEAENVRFYADSAPRENLGGAISVRPDGVLECRQVLLLLADARRAADAAKADPRRALHDFRDADVGDLWNVGRIKQDVLWLDVQVDDAPLVVEVREPLGDARCDLPVEPRARAPPGGARGTGSCHCCCCCGARSTPASVAGRLRPCSSAATSEVLGLPREPLASDSTAIAARKRGSSSPFRHTRQRSPLVGRRGLCEVPADS